MTKEPSGLPPKIETVAQLERTAENTGIVGATSNAAKTAGAKSEKVSGGLALIPVVGPLFSYIAKNFGVGAFLFAGAGVAFSLALSYFGVWPDYFVSQNYKSKTALAVVPISASSVTSGQSGIHKWTGIKQIGWGYHVHNGLESEGNDRVGSRSLSSAKVLDIETGEIPPLAQSTWSLGGSNGVEYVGYAFKVTKKDGKDEYEELALLPAATAGTPEIAFRVASPDMPFHICAVVRVQSQNSNVKDITLDTLKSTFK